MARKRTDQGRYDFEANLDALCSCGHTFSMHSAGSDSECLNYSMPAGEKQAGECDCQRFSPIRKTRGRK